MLTKAAARYELKVNEEGNARQWKFDSRECTHSDLRQGQAAFPNQLQERVQPRLQRQLDVRHLVLRNHRTPLQYKQYMCGTDHTSVRGVHERHVEV